MQSGALIVGWMPGQGQHQAALWADGGGGGGSGGGGQSDGGAAAVTTAVAANGALFVVTVVIYQIYKGLAIAAGIRTGNAVGAGQAATARRECWLGVGATAAVALITAGLYAGTPLSRIAPGLVSADDAVVALVESVAVPAALSMCGFALLIISLQLLSACGRNREGTLFAFAGCWLVGVTLSAVLAIPLRHGLRGIWYGNACGLWCAGLLGVGRLASIDWAQEAALARQRMSLQ
eukprot:SAG22_NODE_1761_length_3632_cov_33.614492_3_plen_235_part_00